MKDLLSEYVIELQASDNDDAVAVGIAIAKYIANDLLLRKQLERMAILYHQTCGHKGGFTNCKNPHCAESRNLTRS